MVAVPMAVLLPPNLYCCMHVAFEMPYSVLEREKEREMATGHLPSNCNCNATAMQLESPRAADHRL